MPTQSPACRQSPDDWFSWPGSVKANRAKTLCMACPLMLECRRMALVEGIPEGIWGGLDRDDRERIWAAGSGKPSGFMDAIDAAIGPLLQARRDFEHDEWSESA